MLYIINFIIYNLFFQEALLNSAWKMLEIPTKTGLEEKLDCCGLLNSTAGSVQFEEDFKNCPAVCLVTFFIVAPTRKTKTLFLNGKSAPVAQLLTWVAEELNSI